MLRVVTITALLALACARLAAGPEPADRVLRRGNVYVGDILGTHAQSLAIRGGTLVYVGDDAGVEAYVGPDTHVLELDGRSVLPGLHDAHVHPISAGLEAQRCALAGLAGAAAIEARIRTCAEEQRARAWVLGAGWELPAFPDANPSKSALDGLVPDRPALLVSADGHSAWVNTRALAAARITRGTADPPGGRIERDPRSGDPSGTLRESAIELVARVAPPPNATELDGALAHALGELARLGIVCAHEANASPAELEAHLRRGASGARGPRVRIALALPPDAASTDPLDDLRAARARGDGARVRVVAVKLFLDGVIESRTAALLEPYADGGGLGPASFTPDALDALVTRLDAAGFQVHMHAIGDRAVRMGLDAVARARAANGARDARPTIAHLELVAADDLPRFATLGVAPNVQALWAQNDAYIRDLTIPRLGDERSLDLYPIGSLFATGAVVAAGSDWPVSSANPLEAIEVGITRRAHDLGPGPGWIPEQRASLAQMLGAYTRGGAWLDFEEHERGTLEVGKRADVVVLDRDLEALAPEQISDARVVETIADGVTIWPAQ